MNKELVWFQPIKGKYLKSLRKQWGWGCCWPVQRSRTGQTSQFSSCYTDHPGGGGYISELSIICATNWLYEPDQITATFLIDWLLQIMLISFAEICEDSLANVLEVLWDPAMTDMSELNLTSSNRLCVIGLISMPRELGLWITEGFKIQAMPQFLTQNGLFTKQMRNDGSLQTLGELENVWQDNLFFLFWLIF